MTITAKIIADSISPQGIRLTTFQLRYPRFIHAEELTHRIINTQPELLEILAIPDGLMYDRDLSRNASSSRAIPVLRLIADVMADPVYPMFWGRNQQGMQAREELDPQARDHAKLIWERACIQAVAAARDLAEIGAHKQIVNRLLEPFSHINVVCTATQFSNFFALRDHPDAQPEIMLLAQEMKRALAGSVAKRLKPGDWHLPYYDSGIWEQYGDRPEPYDINGCSLDEARSISVARCARVSYRTHDGRIAEHEEEVELCKRLLAQIPLHASPAEHQATPDVWSDDFTSGKEWDAPHEHGNLNGWRQYRKMLAGECQ